MLPANHVWVYITDLIPRQMVEFGHRAAEAKWRTSAKWAQGELPPAVSSILGKLCAGISQRCGPISLSSFSAQSTW